MNAKAHSIGGLPILHVGGGTDLFHSTAQMKETRPAVMP